MSKLINISDETYKKLSQLKGKESYTIVIKNLLEKRSNKEAVLSFFGKGGIYEEKVKEAEKMIRKWSIKSV